MEVPFETLLKAVRRLKMRSVLIISFMLCSLSAQRPVVLEALKKPVLGLRQGTLEVQVYTGAKVLPVPHFRTAAEWESYAAKLREEVLAKAILRGEAAGWNEAKTKVEWLDAIDAEGYRVKKLRYEALPGLWIPALLYEPAMLSGKVPAVLNVNGHEEIGKATPDIQARCINLAKRGILALNPEWVGKGQLDIPNFDHARMNQVDLTGTSGVGIHFLAQKRALDLLLAHKNTDANRVAVTGLSGGSWQTIIISSLDTRVKLANPVAGYSSYLTRSQWPEPDLGDSEQTPTDLGSVADYTHLTGMLAPRPALLTHNSRDNCCFRADYAMSPLLMAARPIYQLFGKPGNLRYHINYDDGHNYGQDNREAFYRALRDYFFAENPSFSIQDIPVEKEIRTRQQLDSPLPADNLSFHQIAMNLSRQLPRRPELPRDQRAAAAWQDTGRAKLRGIVRAYDFPVEAIEAGSDTPQGADGLKATYWKLQMGEAWTVPAVELASGTPESTALVVADGGRAGSAAEIERLLAGGQRVVAMDPFYFGESRIDKRDWLFAILLAALGDRPLGLQASQVVAAARWLQSRNAGPVTVVAIGPRSSLFALVAAGIEPKAIAGLQLHESFGSLKEIIEKNMTVRDAPELFCFGLLEEFDIRQMVAMVAPRPVRVMEPSARAKAELAGLPEFFGMLGVRVDPVKGD